MNAVLFLSLVIILSAALWPKGAYGGWRHHRLKDRQLRAHETKIINHQALQKAAVKLKALDVRPSPEASQEVAVRYVA